jgi:serine/threonine-protein kinase HipA
MRRARVFFRKQEAGLLAQLDDGSFTFSYHPAWVHDSGKPPISLTLPKKDDEYRSGYLFPFFFNLLPEGENLQTVCRANRIDEDDLFGILMATAGSDPIGAVRVVGEVAV